MVNLNRAVGELTGSEAEGKSEITSEIAYR
jgi:hypothetical protein